MLALTAIVMVHLRNLFSVVMLSGLYSLISAGIFMTLDAVDVAFTEAAVGAGITTVLFLGTLALTGSKEKEPFRVSWIPFAVVVITGVALIYGTLDMPHFGDAEAPVHRHVAPRYIHESPHEVGPPNMVTSVLASYRGYDTLGETTVIFTAGIAVMLIFSAARVREGGGKES